MKKVLINNEKELYTKCADVTPSDTKIFDDVYEVFTNGYKCIGLGLAANQIGYTKNYIVISPTAEKSDILELRNPKIINHGKEIEYAEEGCLSYPKVRKSVGRYRVIDVEYHNTKWEKVNETFKGLFARIIQHEIDHLLGLNCLENKL